MKILALTSMYPPHHVGGYELQCREMVEHLEARGHSVTVLTSWRGRRRPWREGGTRRWLCLTLPRVEPTRADVLRDLMAHAYNRVVTLALLRLRRPDAVVVSHCGGLGAATVASLHRRGRLPVVHHVCDTYLPHLYEIDPWFSLPNAPIANPGLRAARTVLLVAGRPWLGRPERLDLSHSYFRSRWLLEAHTGVPHLDVAGAEVIPEGAPDPAPESPPERIPESVLFTGRLVPDKGPQVLLEALAQLSQTAQERLPFVTVAGAADDAAFGERLRERAESTGVDVRFAGQVPHDEALALMQAHAIFVYPVTWQEPSGGALPEAMAAGMAMVATGTGGSGELLEAGKNCLLVPAGDADALARALERLLTDEALRSRLAAGARGSAARHPRRAALEAAEARVAATAGGAR